MALQDKGFIQFNFENRRQFNNAINRSLEKVSNLKPAFTLIAQDFYRSQKAIFQLKSKGGYKDLTTAYKDQKFKDVGFIYPILKRTGRLEKSTTGRSHPDSFLNIKKQFMEIGTKTPYAVYHDSDLPRNKMPQRKIVFIGPESRAFNAKDRANGGGRLTRWTRIIEKTTDELLKAGLGNV